MAIFDSGVFDSSVFDSEVGPNTIESAFSVSALVVAVAEAHFHVEAEVASIGRPFWVDATFLRTWTFSGSSWTEEWPSPELAGDAPGISVDAVLDEFHVSFSVNAIISETRGGWWYVNAIKAQATETHFHVEAWIRTPLARISQAPVEVIVVPTDRYARATQVVAEVIFAELRFTTRAVLTKTMVPAIPPATTGFFVEYRWGPGGSFAIDAIRLKTMPTGSFSLAAMISSGHFTVNAIMGPGNPPLRVPQTGLQAARTGDPNLRSSQAGLQAARSAFPNLLPSQAGLQVGFHIINPNALVAQAGLQVARTSTSSDIRVSVFGYERARSNPEPRVVAPQTGLQVVRTGLGRGVIAQAGIQVAVERPDGTFSLQANIYRPGDMMPPGGFTLDAFKVFTTHLDAAILATMGDLFHARAVVIINVEGDFSLDAEVQLGFLANAVIVANQRAVFALFAYKVVPTTGTGSFSLDAYLSRSFEVRAWITKPRPFTMDAAIIEAGKYLKSFYADAAVASLGEGGEFTLEAEIWTQRTIVHEGAGSTQRSLVHHTERLSFPGTKATENWANPNRLTELFYPADTYPLTITVWEMELIEGYAIGIASENENQWYRPFDGAMYGQYPSVAAIAAGGFTFTAWPMYYPQRHYVYFWPNSNVYNPAVTGSGAVSYYQWEDLTLTLPAPTLDAWIVGTPGTPFTLDAEIVESEKLGLFHLDADLMKAGEKRSTFAVESHLLAPQAHFFVVQAELAALRFTLDALIHQPSFTLDAHIHLAGGADGFFTVSAVLKKMMTWYPNGPKLDAVITRKTGVGSYALDADIRLAGDKRGLIRLDSVLVGAREKRFYLAALIISDVHFTVDAFIGRRLTVDAWIGSIGGGMGSFSVGAYIRGSSIIVFPDDGGPPTDPTGGPPPISRKFRVKIEAFIPDPIPVGNDQEIENLIMKILEAEAELESLYCAVEHYSSQGYPVAGGRNSYGGGYTGSLPSAISQIGYPGAGDIDDCWVVATVWAAIASGQTFTPTVPQFRAWAQNPDRPGATGGTLDHIMRGARGAWPGATIRRYASSDWNGFISLLKAGWTASLAVRSSALPSNLRYGFNGLHQIGVAYQNGSYVIMNPLQSTGSSLHAIDGYDLRTAARGFTGGTICACMFR